MGNRKNARDLSTANKLKYMEQNSVKMNCEKNIFTQQMVKENGINYESINPYH